MSKTNRISLADLGFAITIPDGWRRITHSMWDSAYPAMHYNKNQGRLGTSRLRAHLQPPGRDPAVQSSRGKGNRAGAGAGVRPVRA